MAMAKWNWFHSMLSQTFSTSMIWWKGWIEERTFKERILQKNWWSSGSHPTKPPPSQNGCSPKTFLQMILDAKWLVQHSGTSPKQQQWPLPSLLSDSFFQIYSPPTPLEGFFITFYSNTVWFADLQTTLWGRPGPRFEPGTGDLEAGTLTTRPPHLPVFN